MERTKYKLKCGLSSDDLLIEFENISVKQDFINYFAEVIDTIDGNVFEIEELHMNDQILYHFESDIGDFSISADNLGSMIILPDENCNVIFELDKLFKNCYYFQSVEN